MDILYLKFLLYINKKGKVSKSELCEHFNISPSDSVKIISYLQNNNYIVYASDTSFRSLYKGKHILKSLFIDWLTNNFLAIIAIIISVIALFQ